MHDDEKRFIDAILANPTDLSAREIYADWLEERGDVRAEFLRLEAQLADIEERDPEFERLTRELREKSAELLDHNELWFMTLSRSPVENCKTASRPLRFKFRCPKQWDRLTRMDTPDIRFCDQCEQSVYYCRSIEQARERAFAGECVALDPTIPRHEGDLIDRGIMMGALVRYDD